MKSSEMKKNRKYVYCSIAAQPDNLGDIEIRRILIEWLTETGCPVKVFTGAMPQAYIDAFGLSERCQLISSPVRFQGTLLKDLLLRRAHLVYAPGPHWYGRRRGVSIATNVNHLFKPLINLANSLLVRASGGKVIAVGRAVRGSGEVPKRIEQAMIKCTNLFTTRDNSTSQALCMDLRIEPDLAFANVTSVSTPLVKDILAISLRGDRSSVRTDLLTSAIAAARRAGLKPVFVTQVRSDDSFHLSLAECFGMEVVEWGSRSHQEQMERVADVYKRSTAVISDRLHALIFGLQHKAIPMAVVHTGNDKLPSSLDPFVTTVKLLTDSQTWERLVEAGISSEELRVANEAAANSARERLLVLKTEIANLLALG